MSQILDVVPAGKADSVALANRESVFLPVMTMEMALSRRDAIVEFTKRIMVPDQDFGVIPGTKKPSLLKPGAEKLCCFFGLEPEFTPIVEDADWTGDAHKGEPFFYVRYRCRLLRDGRVLGVGEGSCNSWESKYRYRQANRKCPQCDKETIIKGKEEYGGGWLCFAKKGGCGAKFGDKDPAIMAQALCRVPNPDIADVVNTIQKMAQKRALVAATLIATSASEFFTQDTEDQPHEEPIDTGGHAMNTREAQEYVRDQKLSVARAQQDGSASPAATPAVPVNGAVAQAVEVPPAVKAIWDRMGTKASTITAELMELQSTLVEEMGIEEGLEEYTRICVKFANGKPVSSVSFARRTALELWNRIQLLKHQADLAREAAKQPPHGELFPKEVAYGPQ